jgi:hypothetical protein
VVVEEVEKSVLYIWEGGVAGGGGWVEVVIVKEGKEGALGEGDGFGESEEGVAVGVGGVMEDSVSGRGCA